MRILGREVQRQKTLRELMVENTDADTRTHKVLGALEEICMQFDLAKPIWLERNINEFQKHAKTRFTADSFVEEIPFDYLELSVIEED